MPHLLLSPEAQQICANALRWERWGSLTDWAESHIVLPEKTPLPGPLDMSFTPYGRLMIDSVLYSWTEKVTVIAGSQMVKTLLEIILVCYMIDQHPTNALFLMGREKDAKEIAIERIGSVILSSPKLAKYIKNEKTQITQAKISINGATAFFGSANVAAELSQRSIEYGVADETHLYKEDVGGEGSPLFLMDKRLSNYPGAKRIDASTPTDQYALSWQEYLQGTMHYWQEQCPHCGKYQGLELKQIKHPDSITSAQEIIAEKAAHYECVECEGVIGEDQKSAMLASGKWFTDCGLEHPPHYSFQISGIASPWRTFSKIKAEFMKAKDDTDKLRAFRNTTIGENYEQQRDYLSKKALKVVAQDEAALPRGVCPNNTMMLTFGSDWHGGKIGLFYLTLAFTPGPEIWIVDFGGSTKKDSDEKIRSEEELLKSTLVRKWMTADGRNEIEIVGGVDSGWETADVFDYCRPYYPRLRPTKGDDVHMTRTSPLRESPVDYTCLKTNKRYQGFNCLHIKTGWFKDLLAKMLKSVNLLDNMAEDEKKEAQERENEEGRAFPRLHICQNATKDLIRSLSSERKVRRDKKWGWWPINESTPNNHLLDCFVQAYAMAEFRGLSRLNLQIKNQAKPGGKVARKAGGQGSPYAHGGRPRKGRWLNR